MQILSALGSKKRVHILIDDHVIRYLEVNQGDIHAVRNLGEKELPLGMIQEGKIQNIDGLVLILEQCVHEWKLKNGKVCFLVPDASLLIRKVTVPLGIKENEIKGYLYLEIGSKIHLPFEQPIIDYILLEQDEEHYHVLLIAAPEEVVSQYMALLEEVKLKPTVADISSLAHYRVLHRLGYAKAEEHLLELQVTLNTAHVCIFHQNKPMFFRHINLNLPLELWESSQVNGSVEWEWQGEESMLTGALRELLSELERIINFYHFSISQGRYTVNRIFLTGDYPYMNELKSHLEQTFQLPVQTLQSANLTTIDNRPISTRYHSLLGLALREVT